MNPPPAILRLLITVILVNALAFGSRAEDACPADKPHARRVAQIDHAINCMANIITKLRCPRDEAEPCYYVARQKCEQPKTVRLCLSDDELRESLERE